MIQKVSPIVSCLLPVIENGEGGLYGIQLAAETIAAEARFNIRLMNLKRDNTPSSRLDLDSLLRLSDLVDEATLACQAAMQMYRKNNDLDALVDSLRNVVTMLDQHP